MHENTKAALLLAENFIDTYGDNIPEMNVEILNGTFEVHVHLHTTTQLNDTHRALGSPKWRVSDATDTSASIDVDKGSVTIYYSAIRDEPAAQASLRKIGLVKGLVAVK